MLADGVGAIHGAVARVDDIYHPRLVEISITLIIEHHGSIGAILESLGIIVVAETENTDVMVAAALQFHHRPLERFAPVLEVGQQPRRALGQTVLYVIAMQINLLAAAQCAIELEGRGKAEMTYTREGYVV